MSKQTVGESFEELNEAITELNGAIIEVIINSRWFNWYLRVTHSQVKEKYKKYKHSPS